MPRKIDLTKIPDADFNREWVRRLNLRRDPSKAGRKKELRPCPHCRKKFGGRDLRKHIPQCDAKQEVL